MDPLSLVIHLPMLALGAAVVSTASAAVTLQPAHHEKAFWSDPAVTSSLQWYDMLFALLAVYSNCQHYRSIRSMTSADIARVMSSPSRSWRDFLEYCVVYNNTSWFIGFAAAQLAWAGLAPRAYARHRHAVVLLSRVLRLVIFVSCITCLVQPSSHMPKFYWQWVQRDIAATDELLARRPLVLVVLRMLAIYGGGNHIALHTFMALLPASQGGWFNLATFALGNIHQLPTLVGMVQAVPAGHSITRALCVATTAAFDSLVGLPPGPHQPCSQRMLEAVYGAATMLWGCLLPFVIAAVCEYHAKLTFVDRIHAERRQAAACHSTRPPPAAQQSAQGCSCLACPSASTEVAATAIAGAIMPPCDIKLGMPLSSWWVDEVRCMTAVLLTVVVATGIQLVGVIPAQSGM